MRRVLFLANASSIHTIRWVNAIADRGYDVHLLSLHPVQQALAPRVTYYQAPFPPSWGYFTNWPWVRKIIARVEPDLVHAHYATGYGTVASLADFHPTILSVWGLDVFAIPYRSFLHKYLVQFNLARADKILSTSHVMARETGKYTCKPIEVTPFGVDLNQFKPQSVKSLFEDHDIVIGTIKSLDERYGIEYLIRAFKVLKNKFPDLPLRLLIVGEGTEESNLKNLVKGLGLTQDTVFTGRVSHAEVPKYQNMLSVSVSVSISDSESFGVSVIEASACCKPVVVSRVGGLPEVVEDGVTGFVVQPKNPQQTADAIERLILDDDLRAKMGQAGRERVQRLYNWDDNVSQMVGIYQVVLQK